MVESETATFPVITVESTGSVVMTDAVMQHVRLDRSYNIWLKQISQCLSVLFELSDGIAV